MIGEIIKVSPDYQLAVEVALGASVNNIVTVTSQDASYLIDILRAERYGRATFLPMDNVRPRRLPQEAERALSEQGVIGLANELIEYENKFSNVISNLLGNVVIVESKEQGIKLAKKYRNLFRIVTLEGDHFAMSGAITGGSAPSLESQVLSQETKIKQLQEQRKAYIASNKQLAITVDEVKEEGQETERATKVLQAQLHKLDMDIATFESNIEYEKQALAQLQQSRAKLADKNQALYGQIQELESAIKIAGAKEGASVSEKQDINAYMDQSRENLIKKKRQLTTLRGEYEEVKLANNTLKTELDNLDDSIRRAKTDITQIEKRIADCKIDINLAEKSSTEAMEAMGKAVFSQDNKEKLEQLKKETESLIAHKAKLQQENEQLDDIRNELGEQITQ